MNNYHISFNYLGSKYDLDIIAFDRGITYEGCLTMYPRDGFRIVVDLIMVKDLKIEAIK